MATVTTITADVALRLHDIANAELTTAQILLLLNQAVGWARNGGLLVPLEEDESLVEVANTYSFTVPTSFAYISRIIRKNRATGTYDGYNTFTPDAFRLGINGSNPTIFFDEARYDPDAGNTLKVVGQKRPSLYTTGADTIDVGLENLLTERTLFYAFQFLAAGRSEYAVWRQQEAMIARAESELALSRAPQQFRMKSNSRYVPGR